MTVPPVVAANVAVTASHRFTPLMTFPVGSPRAFAVSCCLTIGDE